MKIANNISLPRAAVIGSRTALILALGVLATTPWASAAEGVGAAPYAAAQTASQPPAIVPTSPAAAVPTAPSVPSVPTAPAASLVPSSTTVPTGVPGLPEAGKGSESIDKSMSLLEDKAVDNAKSAVKKLDSVSEATSLADINRARQALTRIETMIDVEKRLNELEKLRNDRRNIGMLPTPGVGGGVPSSLLESAIPASALAPPASLVPLSVGKDEKKPRRLSSSRPEIAHITGTNGRYSAVLKLSGGDEKSVRVGDKISDTETVKAITSSSVQVGGKDSYTLRVKNVDVVYSTVR